MTRTRTRKPARHLRDPSKPCNAEVNLLMARKDAATNKRLILAAIATRALSVTEIAAVVGISIHGARRHIRFMRADREVHVGRWYRASVQYERMYLAGAGEDAPKPAHLTRAEIHARSRIRMEFDDDLAIAYQMRERARSMRRSREKHLRPDTAASWITPTQGAT